MSALVLPAAAGDVASVSSAKTVCSTGTEANMVTVMMCTQYSNSGACRAFLRRSLRATDLAWLSRIDLKDTYRVVGCTELNSSVVRQIMAARVPIVKS